ncbi:MAG: DUF362 domain-containing protein [Clostridiaceae bacterium]|nr:DUF362 domain-containing protein [Clostridiaceae bacterium]
MGQVVLKKCDSYDDTSVLHALKQVFNALGGIGKYIKPGTKVVLKPNLVRKKRPEEGATTHPSIIKNLSVLTKEAGGTVTIVESPGGLFTTSLLKGVYSYCGIESAANDSGAILNYDLSEIEINNPEGKYLKKVTVVKALKDADLIINLPKLKTHGQMVYTGAVKNMFGAVPGELKAEYHYRMSEYSEFANALIDIYLSVKPSLNIMDAIIGMEGEGPTSGNPRHIGLIIAGEDAFDVDFTALSIIGADPISVPIIEQGIDRKLCPDKIDQINIIGQDIDIKDIKITDFDMPQLDTLNSIAFFSKGVLKFITKRLKPRPMFDYDLCVGCAECMRVCPAKVISMRDKRDKRPEIDLSQCISCFCCQELCPHKAVFIKRHPIIDIYIKHRRRKRLVKG